MNPAEAKAEGRAAFSILNTILLAVCLAVLSWIGFTTHQSATNVAVLVERSSTNGREILELRARVSAIELELVRLGSKPPGAKAAGG